jgi:hypothetical protein
MCGSRILYTQYEMVMPKRMMSHTIRMYHMYIVTDLGTVSYKNNGKICFKCGIICTLCLLTSCNYVFIEEK